MKKSIKKRGRSYKHPVPFMRQVIREMMLDNLSHQEAAIRFNLPNRNTAARWYKTFSSDIQLLNTQENMEEQNQDVTDGEKKVIELQKALAEANMKIVALETMIDIAEQELKVDIRKNSDSKQPNK